jgi:transposase-like protein
MQKISYSRHSFPSDIIRHAVWLYARFSLSYRDVEDLVAERGLDISYETVRRWFLKFGTPIAQHLRSFRPTPNDIWHLDEMSSLSEESGIPCGMPLIMREKSWFSSYNQGETPTLPLN